MVTVYIVLTEECYGDEDAVAVFKDEIDAKNYAHIIGKSRGLDVIVLPTNLE